MSFITGVLGLTAKILVLVIAIKFLWTVLTKGRDAFEEWIQTLIMWMRTKSEVTQRRLFEKYKGSEQTERPKKKTMARAKPKSTSSEGA